MGVAESAGRCAWTAANHRNGGTFDRDAPCDNRRLTGGQPARRRVGQSDDHVRIPTHFPHAQATWLRSIRRKTPRISVLTARLRRSTPCETADIWSFGRPGPSFRQDAYFVTNRKSNGQCSPLENSRSGRGEFAPLRCPCSAISSPTNQHLRRGSATSIGTIKFTSGRRPESPAGSSLRCLRSALGPWALSGPERSLACGSRWCCRSSTSARWLSARRSPPISARIGEGRMVLDRWAGCRFS